MENRDPTDAELRSSMTYAIVEMMVFLGFMGVLLSYWWELRHAIVLLDIRHPAVEGKHYVDDETLAMSPQVNTATSFTSLLSVLRNDTDTDWEVVAGQIPGTLKKQG